jgi:uncharacterized protein (TIGR03086 family)
MSTTLQPHDPRHTFATAVSIAGAAIAAVQPEQLGNPTPCPAHDTRAMVGHMVAVLGRVEALGSGSTDPFALPVVITDVPDDQWRHAWADAAAKAQAAWADPSLLDKMMTLPWAELPGAGVMAMYTSELSVHTWDLAKATGQQPNWDETALATSLAAMRQGLPDDDRVGQFEAARAQMPEQFRDWSAPFASAVIVPDDAPLIDQLVAWTGRDPNR